jgi:hypothetical protein
LHRLQSKEARVRWFSIHSKLFQSGVKRKTTWPRILQCARRVGRLFSPQ